MPCIDTALLWETIAAVNKLADAPEDHPDANVVMVCRVSWSPCHRSLMHFVYQSNQVNPLPVTGRRPLTLSIDNSDLNNIGHMLAQDGDSIHTSLSDTPTKRTTRTTSNLKTSSGTTGTATMTSGTRTYNST